MSTLNRLLAASVILLASAPASAAGRPMTLDEALSMTRQHNHDLAAARAALDAAKTGVERAFDALLPTVTGTGSYVHNYKNVTYANLFQEKNLPPQEAASIGALTSSLGNITVLKGDAVQGTLGVNAPLVSAPAWFGLTAAKQTYRAEEADGRVTETTVLFAAAQTFYAAAGADELLEARRHAVAVAHGTLENAQALLRAGKATRLDLDRADLALVNAEQALREAQDTRDASYRALATITGVRDDIQVVPPARDSAPAPEVGALVEGSLQLRPEFAAYNANIDASREQSKASLWQWAPTLSAFGTLNGYNYAGITGDYYSWALGLQLNWVIYDGGVRDAARRQAEARRIESEEHLAQLKSSIADDITNATYALKTRRQGVESAEHGAAIATEALDLVRVQYTAGTATQLDVLTAQDALVNAEVRRAQSRFDLALAELAVRHDAGTFPADAGRP